ncbi:hypothetical protein [Candidatus Coxiella mudrowiae]|uniref:hypothetical protein n=1 Tax=Candidatus Coxiella mudrowiae TaxID=2054173 RepID=UPI001F2A5DE9|nr:hypothetical protein [Candidatus Coxiella mudrowiae]
MQEYAGKFKPSLYCYQIWGGTEIDLILKTKEKLIEIECVTVIDISLYQQRGMKSFLKKKYPDATGYFIAPIQKSYQLDKNILVIPWKHIGSLSCFKSVKFVSATINSRLINEY